jgi:hypothetical protein
MQPESNKSSRSSTPSQHLDTHSSTSQHGIHHDGAAPANQIAYSNHQRQQGVLQQDGDGRTENKAESDDAEEKTRLSTESPSPLAVAEHPITRYERASSRSPERAAFVSPVLLSASKKGYNIRASPIAHLPNGMSTFFRIRTAVVDHNECARWLRSSLS